MGPEAHAPSDTRLSADPVANPELNSGRKSECAKLSPIEQSARLQPFARLIRRDYCNGTGWTAVCITRTLTILTADIWGGGTLLHALGWAPFAT